MTHRCSCHITRAPRRWRREAPEPQTAPTSGGAYPARRDGHGQAERRRRGAPCADVWNKPQGGGQDPPQDGAGHADEVEPDGDRKAESDIDEQLRQEKAADPRGGVFQCLRGHGHLTSPDQANEAIAQVLTPDQEEHHQHDDDAGRAHHHGHRAERASDDLQGARWREDHANRLGPFLAPRGSSADSDGGTLWPMSPAVFLTLLSAALK